MESSMLDLRPARPAVALVFALCAMACGEVAPDRSTDAGTSASRASCGGSPATPVNISTARLKVDRTVDDTPVPGALLTFDGCGKSESNPTGQVTLTTDAKGEAILDVVSGSPMGGLMVFPKAEAPGLLATRTQAWVIFGARSAAWAQMLLLDEGWTKILPAHGAADGVALIIVNPPVATGACHTVDKGVLKIDDDPSLPVTYYSAAAPFVATGGSSTTSSGLAAIVVPPGRSKVTATWSSGCSLTATAQFEAGVVTLIGLL